MKTILLGLLVSISLIGCTKNIASSSIASNPEVVSKTINNLSTSIIFDEDRAENQLGYESIDLGSVKNNEENIKRVYLKNNYSQNLSLDFSSLSSLLSSSPYSILKNNCPQVLSVDKICSFDIKMEYNDSASYAPIEFQITSITDSDLGKFALIGQKQEIIPTNSYDFIKVGQLQNIDSNKTIRLYVKNTGDKLENPQVIVPNEYEIVKTSCIGVLNKSKICFLDIRIKANIDPNIIGINKDLVFDGIHFAILAGAGTPSNSISCESSYISINNVCTKKTQIRECIPQPDHSQDGSQESSDGGQNWSSCQEFSCVSNYSKIGNACLLTNQVRSCIISNSVSLESSNDAGQTWGTCTVQSCNSGFTKIANTCVASNQTRACLAQPANSSNGLESSIDGGQNYGSCTGYSCNTNYTNVSGSCVLTNQSLPCSILNGSGTQLSTNGGVSYGSCTLASCNSGYTPSGNACLLTNQSRSCTVQPTFSTGGQELSNNAGQTWGSCQGFTCTSLNYYVTESGTACSYQRDRVITSLINAPYTTITNRSKVIDFSNDLSINMGINRILINNLVLKADETGPSGKAVYTVPNDTLNQIRFVGTWGYYTTTAGSYASESTVNGSNYTEITFYGTGLNALLTYDASVRDARFTVDGGAESGNIYTANLSPFLVGRSYNANQVYKLVSGLPLGMHTVKLRNASASISHNVYGFEIINERSNILQNAGKAFYQGLNLELFNPMTLSYNSNFESGILGTKGGRVVVYMKNDGTIAKAVNPTNANTLYLTNADHSNEVLTKTIDFRNFGIGRSDDFQTLAGTDSARSFTLNDGTTLLATNSSKGNNDFSGDTLHASPGAFIALTFVGTGLDILGQGDSLLKSYSVSIDGASSVGNVSIQQFVNGSTLIKVASGLPFGTHTVRLTQNSGNRGFGIKNFQIYNTKKPTIPAQSTEIGEYFLMANYVPSSAATVGNIGTGVIRKQLSVRESIYNGSWVIAQDVVNFDSATDTHATASGATVSYTFYGTGFEWRGLVGTSQISNSALTINGVSNLSSYTTSFIQTASGVTFNPTTGVLAGTNIVAINKIRLSVSGLPLGLYTIKWTHTGPNFFNVDSFDIISPVYMPEISGTANNGSSTLGDLRQLLSTP